MRNKNTPAWIFWKSLPLPLMSSCPSQMLHTSLIKPLNKRQPSLCLPAARLNAFNAPPPLLQPAVSLGLTGPWVMLSADTDCWHLIMKYHGGHGQGVIRPIYCGVTTLGHPAASYQPQQRQREAGGMRRESRRGHSHWINQLKIVPHQSNRV